MQIEPPVLRLHIEDELYIPDPVETFSKSVPGLKPLLDLFGTSTGWELAMLPTKPGNGFYPHEYSADVSAGGAYELQIVDMIEDFTDGQHCVRRDLCDQMANSLNQLMTDLCRSRRAVQQLNAEIATSVPVTVHEDHNELLQAKLEKVLRQGIETLGMNSSGVYLLDDATQALALRFHVGLSAESLLHPPRELSETVADLEALVGNAIAVSDIPGLPHWNIPESFPSGICVPVATHANPLGTLWFFSEQKREFDAHESRIAELVGGRVSAELERESAVKSASVSQRVIRDIERTKVWQQVQTPVMMPAIDQWKVVGDSILPDTIGGAFHDHSVNSNGMITASVAEVEGAMIESGMAAASLRGAIRAHNSYNLKPQEFLRKVNNTLWDCPLGDQLASLFYAQIEPETGIARWANAGQTAAMILGTGAEAEISWEGTPLGVVEDEGFESRERVLLPGSILFGYNEGFRQLIKMAFRKNADVEIFDLLCEENLRTADELKDWIGRLVENYDSYRRIPDVSFVAIERGRD